MPWSDTVILFGGGSVDGIEGGYERAEVCIASGIVRAGIC
jgi:hypothetical protein